MESRFQDDDRNCGGVEASEPDHLGDQVQKQVGDRPFASLALAAAVGIGVGFAVSTLLSEEQRQRRNRFQALGEQISNAVIQALPRSFTK